MQNSIVSRRRPRDFARVCASCARAAGVTTNTTPSIPSRAFSAAARTSSTTSPTNSDAKSALRRPLPPTLPTPQQRWLSTSKNNRLPNSAAAEAPPNSADGSTTGGGDPSSSAEERAAAAVANTSNGEPDYYALFPRTLPLGPPPAGAFEIDVRALRREFLQMQAAVHPDFHHAAGSSSISGEGGGHSSARRQAEAVSALINAAYKTLSSPLLRAQHLLRRQHNLDLAGDEAASLTKPDPELLGLVLEVREAIDEVEEIQDDQGVDRRLEEMREENEGRVSECERGLGEAFKEGDVQGAVGISVRLKYWLNVRETLHNWERGKPIVLQH